jgi:hypothetical protein
MKASASLQVGLSVSVSSDLDSLELEQADLHRFAVRLARVVLDRDGAIVSGHDWRPHGVMRALVDFARRYAKGADDRLEGPPPLRNIVPWPDQPTLDDRQRAGLAHVLRVETLGLPEWCRRSLDALGGDERIRDQLARLFAVSDLRVHLAVQTSARVCVGGKTSHFSGRFPGILEEVALSLAKNQPVYLVGFAGGATGQLISMLRTGKVDALARSIKDDRDALRAAFNAVKPKVKVNAKSHQPSWLPAPSLPWEWSVRDLLSFIFGKRELFSPKGNGLERAENEALWDATSSDVAIDWILRGLARLPSKSGEKVSSRNGAKTSRSAQAVGTRSKRRR